ncbi:MAG TPA: glycosyltransferase [Candidatus Atribacteria bacterium]|nr:glycosyltransferase [Candidatus Atribacteria bacterium]
MKVFFIPYDREGNNPYQNLLLNHLQDLGVKVEGSGTYRIFSLLRSTFSHWKPDILHLHWHHPFLLGSNITKTIIKSVSFIAELLILKLVEVKIVWTVHNIVSHEGKFESLELFFTKLLAKMCNKIIVHSPSAKREIVKIYRASESLIKVIPHGNYINCYRNVISKAQAKNKLQLKAEKIIFLYFGLIRPYKGISELIQAFNKLNYSRTRLLIVGKPINNEIVHDILKKCEENENIKTFFEFIPDDEIQIYMNAADVVVLPYRDILTSGAIILAMSFGKPVIAPAIGCIPETLDIEGSFLYEPSEKDGLIKAMRQVFNADLIKMGNHNFELAKQFRWGKIAKKTYEVYCDCLKRKK